MLHLHRAVTRSALCARALPVSSSSALRLSSARPPRQLQTAAATHTVTARRAFSAAATKKDSTATAAAGDVPPAATSAASVAGSVPSEPVLEPLTPLAEVDLATLSPPIAKHAEHGYVVYASPFEKVVRTLKMLSLTSASLSIASAPILVLVADAALPLAGRLAVAGTVLVFGVSTTLFLTYFLKSYVVRIFARKDLSAPVSAEATTPDAIAGEQWRLTVQTLNMLGKPVYTHARHCDMHPLVASMFNNTRLSSTFESSSSRDLFVHLDLATNPLLRPVWAKATIVSSKPNAIDIATAAGEERAELEARLLQPDAAITKEEALRDIAAANAQRQAAAKDASDKTQ